MVPNLRSWLSDEALPLWGANGVDAAGGFCESLSQGGVPNFDETRRVLVQARQIYTFSHAAVLGHAPGIDVASRGYSWLLRHGCPDGAANGFVTKLSGRGVVIESRRDTYTHAFLLLAVSWFYRATRNDDVLITLESILEVLQKLRDPMGFGYLEGSDAALPRRQNPHMHLFEAYLAAYYATGRSDMLIVAREIYDLFVAQFFDGNVLREFFTENWMPAYGDAGQIIEPGHHFEWVWLLWQHDLAAGTDSTEIINALVAFAARFGVAKESGLIANEL